MPPEYIAFRAGGSCFLGNKGNEDKVWILVARPLIWIDEEIVLQDQGKAFTPKTVWEKEPEKEEQQPPPKPLPGNDKVRQILQAVVTEVLTKPSSLGSLTRSRR